MERKLVFVTDGSNEKYYMGPFFEDEIPQGYEGYKRIPVSEVNLEGKILSYTAPDGDGYDIQMVTNDGHIIDLCNVLDMASVVAKNVKVNIEF